MIFVINYIHHIGITPINVLNDDEGKVHNNFNPNLNIIKSQSENITNYDQVEDFPKGISLLELNLHLQKNIIYLFRFETYTPYTDEIKIDLLLKSPSYRLYHCADANTYLNNSRKVIFFEFGAAETGIYDCDIIVNTDNAVNLHIVIEEISDLSTYYIQHTLDVPDQEKIMISDIHQYGLNNLNCQYLQNLTEDTCYLVNFFLVTPILESLINQIPEDRDPIVKMTFLMDGHEYIYYPELPIHQYALKGNINSFYNPLGSSLSISYLIQEDFLLRFGAASTSLLTIDIEFTNFWPFDANYGFIFYEKDEIGNGPENSLENDTQPIDEQVNETASNITDSVMNLSERIELKINQMYIQFTTFCIEHFWSLVIGISGVIIGVAIMYRFYTLMQTKHSFTLYPRESDSVDG